jgi:hypothetical protein
MKTPVTFLAVLCLAAGTALAQAPQAPTDKSAARAEMREKMRAAHEKAEAACKGKAGAEHRQCMVHEMCAQSKDPKACEARAAKAKDNRQEARKACEGKTGAEHDQCMITQRCSQAKDPKACEAHAKERMARVAQAREACKDKKGDDLKACLRAQRPAKK